MGLTLVILAAGMGRRYGGLKQMDPVGTYGELIIDYSVFDAVRAGFDRFVFVIRPDMEHDFRAVVGSRIEPRHECVYVHQTLKHGLSAGYRLPRERAKPLGTAHAVFACADTVREPFAVINADDFYGVDAFRQLAAFLADQPADGADFAMVAYRLRNTLSEHGTVARGICSVSGGGLLQGVVENTEISLTADGICGYGQGGSRRQLDGESPVSMNCWGFTPSLFPRIAVRLPVFLQHLRQHPDAEFFLPTVVDELLRNKECRVRVLPTEAQWFGVTYPDDKPVVRERISAMAASGLYPVPLWR